MKRYIRLKGGEIFDTARYEIDKHMVQLINFYDKRKVKDFYVFTKDIIAESDDFVDLITFGDLVKSRENVCLITEQEGIDFIKQVNGDFITELYTKQGDNYVLVWDSERGVV